MYVMYVRGVRCRPALFLPLYMDAKCIKFKYNLYVLGGQRVIADQPKATELGNMVGNFDEHTEFF